MDNHERLMDSVISIEPLAQDFIDYITPVLDYDDFCGTIGEGEKFSNLQAKHPQPFTGREFGEIRLEAAIEALPPHQSLPNQVPSDTPLVQTIE